MNAEDRAEISTLRRAYRELLDGPPPPPSDARLWAMAAHAASVTEDPMPPAPEFDGADDPMWRPEHPVTYLFLSARRMGPAPFVRFKSLYELITRNMAED